MKNQLVYGFGVNDLKDGKRKSREHRIIYLYWKRMIRRCYSGKELTNKTSYKDVQVCKAWRYFSSFYNWALDKYVEGFHLDKDLLVKGNKVYSPTTCCFLPVEINSFICLNKKKRGELPIGVVYRKDTKKYIAQIYIDNKNKYIGDFLNIEDAFNAYKIEKEKQAKVLAERWKGFISKEVYDALCNYNINVDD